MTFDIKDIMFLSELFFAIILFITIGICYYHNIKHHLTVHQSRLRQLR